MRPPDPRATAHAITPRVGRSPPAGPLRYPWLREVTRRCPPRPGPLPSDAMFNKMFSRKPKTPPASLDTRADADDADDIATGPAAKTTPTTKASKGTKGKPRPEALSVPRGNLLQVYTDLRRKGEPVSANVLNQLGDMYRDLGNTSAACERYYDAAQQHVQDEAWSAALILVKKAERASNGITLPLQFLLLEVAIGQGEWMEAAAAVTDAGKLLTPSAGVQVERLIEIVDREASTDPSVDVALADVLTTLGRADRATERLRVALGRAEKMRRTAVVQDIQERLRQVMPAPTRGPEPRWQIPQSVRNGGDVEIAPPIAAPAVTAPAPTTPVAPTVPPPALTPLGVPPIPEAIPPALPMPGLAPLPALSIPAPAPAPVVVVVPVPQAPAMPSLTPTPSSAPAAEVETPVEIEAGMDAAPPELIDPASLRRTADPTEATTRFVGTDGRDLSDSDAQQLQHLTQQLRDGIRAQIPASDASTQYELGFGFLSMCMYGEAVDAFQKAFRSPAFRMPAVEGLAQAFLAQGDPFLARRALKIVMDELPAATPEEDVLGLLYWTARTAEAMGASADAIEAYERVALVDAAFEDALPRLRTLYRA
jgi:hypothetical protein